MEIQGAVAQVTGANRGFGAALCRVLLEQGAATALSVTVLRSE